MFQWRIPVRVMVITALVTILPILCAGLLCCFRGLFFYNNYRMSGLVFGCLAVAWGFAAVSGITMLFKKYLLGLESRLKSLRTGVDMGPSCDPIEARVYQAAKVLVLDRCDIIKLYQSIMEAVDAGIITVEKTGRTTFINSMAESLLGLDRESALNKKYGELWTPSLVLEKLPSIFSLVGDTLNLGVSYDGIEMDGVHQGNKCTVKITTKILRDCSGNPVGVLLMIKDKTVNRLLEEQLQRNECLSAAGQIAAGIAHEIRNPLQSIKSFVQLLQEKNQGSEEVNSYTDILIDEIERVNSIIKEFLQLSRPAKPLLRHHDLNRLVRETVLLMSGEAALNNTFISGDYGKKIPLLMVDDAQIKQVLINLISNALAAMPQGGTITVRTYYDYFLNEARIEIQDTGVGMDDETLKQLGKPFFTTKDNGTGLGLAVSFRIIQNHGGRTEVSSIVGRGSTFTIILPGLAGLAGDTKGFSEN